jgi:Periplasmic copper-binding protein (NosD)
MQTGTWRASRLVACAVVLLTGSSCTDSRTTTPTGSTTAQLNGSADLSITDASATVCGVIPTTLVITENTRLSCDVVCMNATGPCIQFGKSNITLWLNGFTMTGPATPPANCATSPAFGPGNPGPFPFDGISTAGFDHVSVRGPGMVQQFRRHGIFVFESEKAKIEQVTSHYNCYSGILLGLANDNELKENVSVRNGSASGTAPCGGNCITNSNDNWIHRNRYYGNGSIVAGAPTSTPNDFGVGLVGTSSNNLIEDNSIGGNINGMIIFPTTSGNVIRRNIIAGNPAVQVSVTAGTPVGVDIRDASPPGANRFIENLCVTYEGATVPRPCPNFPHYSTQH